MINCYYRMCGIASTNPSPIYQDDKFELNKLCLKSFVEAYKELDIHITFILDYCGVKYVDMIDKVCPLQKEYLITNQGINETCLTQYNLAKEKEGILLFQECDYLYQNGSGQRFIEAVKELSLVSPYDHPDFYTRYDIQRKETEIKIVGNYHYRKSNRNTMTFAMTSEAFKSNFDILMKHGYLDGPVWEDMRNNGYQLWTPIPSIATHCVRDCMAHGVNWKSIWETLI